MHENITYLLLKLITIGLQWAGRAATYAVTIRNTWECLPGLPPGSISQFRLGSGFSPDLRFLCVYPKGTPSLVRNSFRAANKSWKTFQYTRGTVWNRNIGTWHRVNGLRLASRNLKKSDFSSAGHAGNYIVLCRPLWEKRPGAR